MGLLRILQLSLFGAPEKEPPRVLRPLLAPPVPRPAVIRNKRKSEATLNDLFSVLMKDICGAVAEFSRFDLSRIEVSIGTSRSTSKHGVWAYVTPLRYVGGSLYRKGVRRGVPGVYTYKLGNHDLEVESAPLYLITILVPRFFALSFEERIETLVHELYHLHPEFRGDLRRFPKPHIHHGPTPVAYNRKVKSLVAEALEKNPSLRAHPLLDGVAANLGVHKKRRVSRPTLRFLPKFFAMMIFALSPMLHAAEGEAKWRWPWEDKYSADQNSKDDPMNEEFQEFDRKNSSRSNPRFLVSPKEILSLKSSPSEWSVELLEIKPGQTFLAFTVDPSGEWIFLRSRKVQGWVPVDKLEVVGQLKTPELSGSADFTHRPQGTAANVTSGTLVDGDPIHIPGQGDIAEDDLLNFNEDLDSVFATRAGPLYEQPDPLAIRYGTIQPQDKVLILKRGEKGDWAYIRLVLTGEEGWFPAEWLRITRGMRVTGVGAGKLAVDVEGAYGSAGRNYGLGLGAFYNLLSPPKPGESPIRLETGAFFQSFSGESLQFESGQTGNTYSLVSSYTLLGVGTRFMGYSTGGYFSGAIEAAGTYQLTRASLDGLSDEIIAETRISESLKPRLGLMLGVRGMVSLNSWLQLNALLRMNMATEARLFWGGLGLSFRVF